MGRSAFSFTLLGDLGKGVLAVWAAYHFTGSELLSAVAVLAVVAGHIWPAQLHFHGGKGVASALGALVVYDWQLAVTYAAVFLCGWVISGKTILPGMFAFAFLPFVGYWLEHDAMKIACLSILGGIILFAHRRNLAEEFPALAAHRSTSSKTHPRKL